MIDDEKELSSVIRGIEEKISADGISKMFLLELAFEFRDVDGPLTAIFNAIAGKDKSVVVDDESCENVLKIKGKANNLLLISLCDIALSTNRKYRTHSNLVEDCKALWTMFYPIWCNEGQDHCSQSSFLTVLWWTVFKYPDSRTCFSNMIYNDLVSLKMRNLDIVETLSEIGEDEILSDMFSKTQYEALIDGSSDFSGLSVEDVTSCYYCLKSFIEEPMSKKKVARNKILKKMCNLVLANVAKFNVHFKHTELLVVRSYMDELKSFSDKDYAELDKENMAANEIMRNSLTKFTKKFGPSEEKILNDRVKKNEEKFKSLEPKMRVYYLLSEVGPAKKTDISSVESQSVFGRFVNAVYMKEDGRAINYKECLPEQDFSLKAHNYMSLFASILLETDYYPFLRSMAPEDFDGFSFIDELMESEFLKRDQRKAQIINDLIIKFLSGNNNDSVMNLVVKFEGCLRNYIQSKGGNIYKRDGSMRKIGLGDIFNHRSDNPYKTYLLELIDEGYYFNLTWLLTDEYGFNLRNNCEHDLEERNEMSNKPLAIYATLLIIRLLI